MKSSKVSCPREGYNATLQSSFKTLTSRSGDYVQATAPDYHASICMERGWVGGVTRRSKRAIPCIPAVLLLSPFLPLLSPFSIAKVLIINMHC